MHIVDKFCHFYQDLSHTNLHNLSDIYSVEIHFCDPAHQLQGLDKLTHYFENLLTNVTSLHFKIADHICDDQCAYIKWEMTYCHPRINSGNEIIVPGVSHLQFSDKITYHRDYFDFGCMLYEHLPVMKWAIAKIKQRMTA